MSESSEAVEPAAPAEGVTGGTRSVLLVVAWLWVLIPFAYGLYELIRSMTQLFD